MAEDIIRRQPGEPVSDYAQRMHDLVALILGIVQAEVGMGHDLDDVIAELDFIIEHARDPHWEECWELQLEIRSVISRMTSPTRLHRVLYFAKEMAR